MAAPDRAATRSSAWLLSGLMLVAIGCAAAGLGSVLSELTWWFVLMLVAGVVLLSAAVVRSIAAGRWWPTLAAFVAALVSITGIFAPATAIAWVIPTFDTFGALHEREQAGLASIASQDIPAVADSGILYLICIGIAVIALAMDTAAQLFRAPALAGVPLLVLLLVPSFVRPGLSDPFLFACTAAVFLGMLLTNARAGGRRIAAGIGAATIVAAIVVPLALPAVQPGALANGPAANSVATGINPIVTLGDDLRRGDAKLALTYTTTATEAVYLRLTALDDFTGTSWEPTATGVIAGNNVGAIGSVPGLSDEAVPTSEVVTSVAVGNVLSRWLPVPYAPARIVGLQGTWSWEPDALAIRTTGSNARGQEYEVTSVQVAPSIDQLLAARTTVDPAMERYLDIPVTLPDVVAQTALDVVGDAATNYEKAVALQAYFTGGDFTYSESAPVDQGYDGSGASVLAAFLETKAGYCVHFSSAMASMARTLGVPARVAVGFTPGEAVIGEDGGLSEFRVSTHDLHAWPELFFAGIGWVRFEPTPGRGEAPRFAPLAVDDPATPDVDESVPPAPPAPTSAPTPAPTATPDDEPTTAPTDAQAQRTGSAMQVPWWSVLIAVFVALMLVPAVVRAARRERRLGDLGAGSATSGWEELRDTAEDLGLRATDAQTPRQLARDLDDRLTDEAAAALARLRGAVEAQVFAANPGEPAAADLRLVIRSLRRASSLSHRLAAVFVPRSLFAPWIAQLGRREAS